MTDLRVAVVQLATEQDGAANAAQAARLVEQAAATGARLVLLPEYTLAWAPQLHAGLADAHAALERTLAEAASRHDVWVVAGTLEPGGEPGRLLNVALVLGPDGRVHGRYRKVHLFDAFGVRESDVLDAGEPGAPLVVDVDGWRIGVATCYDLRFPESFRVLVDAGAEAFAVGAAWAAGPGKADQLEVLSRARALESTAYLLLASQGGEGRTGRSAVVGPLGEELAVAASTPEVLVADLVRERLDAVRAQVPSLAHRRYGVVPR